MAEKNSKHPAAKSSAPKRRVPWQKNQAEADNDEHYISKSQAKRDVEELQKLGGRLIKLSKATLEQFDLDEKLLDAILLAQSIHSNSAGRRQLQLIGKIMRQVDSDAIRLQYERYQNQAKEANAHFHSLELWRDRILTEGDSGINELLNEHPGLERSRLRQLLRNAKKESEKNKPPKSARLLFQYLKEMIPDPEQSSHEE